jgi:hypothetical protein
MKPLLIVHSGMDRAFLAEVEKLAELAVVEVRSQQVPVLEILASPVEPPPHIYERVCDLHTFEAPGRSRHKKGKR